MRGGGSARNFLLEASAFWFEMGIPWNWDSLSKGWWFVTNNPPSTIKHSSRACQSLKYPLISKSNVDCNHILHQMFKNNHRACQLQYCDTIHVPSPCCLELNRLENTSDKKFASVPDAKDIPPPVSRFINVFLTTFFVAPRSFECKKKLAEFIFKRSNGWRGCGKSENIEIKCKHL